MTFKIGFNIIHKKYESWLRSQSDYEYFFVGLFFRTCWVKKARAVSQKKVKQHLNNSECLEARGENPTWKGLMKGV